MGIKHIAVKATGDTGLATEWNDDHTIDSDVNFNQFESLSHVIETRNNYPGGPVQGQIIFRTDTLTLEVYDGTNWIIILHTIRSRSLIVAANNSIDKASADYVCDGVDDEVQIQAAIDDLGVIGGTVMLLEGTYDIDAAIIMDNRVTLMGQGKGTKLETDEDIFLIQASVKTGIIIRDIHLVGPSGAGVDETGIYLSECSESKVENCWVEDFNIIGITFLETDNSKVLNNFVDNCGSAGIWIAAIVAGGHNNIITGNYVNNSDRGIYIQISDRNIVCSNQTRNNAIAGIDVAGAATDRTLVHGNISPDGIDDTGTNTVEADNIEA